MRAIVVGIGMICLSIGIGCGGDNVDKGNARGVTAAPTALTAQQRNDAPPDPCGQMPTIATVPILVCSELGRRSGTIELRDEAGAEIAIVPAGTPVQRVKGSDIRRSPGHVDTRVCIATGEFAGRVGYVQNTYIFGGTCE